ncbi:putative protein TPRXL [Anopheles moucheti]|uniref:putative protein TPRXL n=1 Tax=Anopheles moucheti TaxID=186751 RepID=UPI0022F101AA|nr:putative protein TPRXL [Anopheles moucheti]
MRVNRNSRRGYKSEPLRTFGDHLLAVRALWRYCAGKKTTRITKMIKFVCVLALLAASGFAFPVEETPKLSRPSPINPEVASDPKPAALKEVVPASSTTESHIQKVPASGVKLSVEVAKKEETTTSSSSSSTPEQSTKNSQKRSVDSDSDVSTTPKQPAFRRNQPTTTTEEPSSTTPSSTTSSPVSVKTPIGTTRSKREVEVTAVPASSTSAATTKRTTTILPPSHTDEEDGPHYVHPVPVDQILKNLNQPEKASSSGSHHHPEHHTTEKPKDEKDSDESSEEVPPKEAATEQKTHQQTHPVIHQQGA